MDPNTLDSETQKQIQELQIFEQNLQNITMQKQAMQLELSEVENALNELKASKDSDEVYKILGQIMIKTKKTDIEKDLKQKQEILALRDKTLETQEKAVAKNSEELRKKVLGKIQK